MKKEILFAVCLGLIVGLIITFGMYRAQIAMRGSSTTNTDLTGSSANPSATPSSQEDAFPVSEPLDETLTSESSVRVSGKTTPNAAILVLNGNTETVGSADQQGNFSLTVSLTSGANVLLIRSLSDTADPQEVTRTIVYSTVDITQNTPVATSSATAKPTTTPKPTVTPKATPKP